ncbi:GDSL esterase/lipase EXL3-like isoform X2 [Corylus avellana]|uniref:GDSL esterase/lipase EXL3-like isoform X2 n=1 Tax=Corylus avellana TaxID=13451 RepID=UPI00286CFE29|nr:GDSL esterase/lipase EXL3-like isoform X2 [Corylus avellana]
MKGVSLSTKFFFLSSAFAIFFTTEAVIKIPGNETVSAVLMFGDSIVDTGNNNDLNTIAKCNFLPYGREFKGGMPTGRFSNGKVPSDFLGGAGYDHLTSTTASAISLSEQIQDFKKYIGKLKGMVGEERTNFILAKCVTFSVASSNDITNTYFISGIRKLNYDFPSYTDYLVESASNFVKELYGLGIRRIGVFSAPPLGCLPSQKTLNGYSGKGCVNYLNEASKLFNAKLSAEMGCLNNNLPHARVVYIDVYNPLLNIVQDPKKYGLEIANKGCCGTGIFEVSILCNQLDPGTCADDSKYVFFDSYHPTERTYKIIVSQLLQKYIKSFL